MPTVWHRLLRPVLGLALVAVCLVADASDLARAPTVRVRIEWTADAPAIWAGRLTVSGGRLDGPQSLGSARDDAGTISLDRGALSLRRRSPRQNDVFEVSVTAAPDSRLEFELRDRHGNLPAQTIHLALADCWHKPRAFAADGHRPRVVVRRVPGDALAVTFDRPHLVFDPEDSFRMSVALNLLDSHDGLDKPAKALLKWKLLPADGNRPAVDGSTTVSARINPTSPVLVPLELRLPRDEGVYNLRLAATGLGFPDVERIVQLVIVDPTPTGGSSRAGGGEPKLVDSFEPGSPGLFRKVPVNSLRLKNDHLRLRSPKARRSRDESEDSADRGETSCHAYKLHVAHPGQAHRLEVAVPDGSEQNLTIAIWQTDGQGQFVPAGPEGMFSAPGLSLAAGLRATDASAQTCTYSQIFWPHDREPVVVVSGRRSGKPADVSRVKVYELEEMLPGGPRNGPASELADQGGSGLPQRLVGRYLHKPNLAANFGAPQFFDAAEHLSLDDWQTFLLSGMRLVEQLRRQQHSALMLAVYADGATIYPSRLVEPSLQYDNGWLASGGQDPVQKDILELILRLFDRAGLALVPELQFNTPLPELEQMLEKGAAGPEDLLLVDGEGRSRGEAPTSGGGAPPRYNVLAPQVQQVVLAMVRELLERYREHPALAGVAIELGPDSFVQLPGIEWGYDRQTIRRFEQATRIAVPRGEGKDAQRDVYRFLTTSARREWLRYRCSEVARFHRQLADLVANTVPQARVIFSGHVSPMGDSDSEAAVLEAVRAGGSPAQLLLGQGLDFSQPAYAADRRVTVLRPLVQNPAADLLVQAALATLNFSPAIDGLYRTGRGGLLYSVGGGEYALRPEAGAGRSAGLPAPSSLTAEAQRYTHLTAALDADVIFDGGSTIPLTSDEATLKLRRTIARLPDISFQPAGPQFQPVAVRAAHAGNATWLYAANDSPLPIVVELVLDCPATTACRALESGSIVALEPVEGNRKCRLQIEPGEYGVWGCRLGRAGVGVLETRLSVPEDLLAGLQQRIDFLGARMNTATSLARAGSKSLPNPGFENAGEVERELPGWELPVVSAGWTLDEDNPRSGHRSLQLKAEGKRPLLESPALALEGSRYVTMSSWMRCSKSAVRVQMAFDAKIDGEPFRQEAVVEVGKSWKQYFFRVDPLPAGQMHNARLRVKPVDSCKLWIDDVEIDAQSFSADEVRQLTKTLSSVKLAWDDGRYADCQRLLDGYWGQLLLSEPVAGPAVLPPRTRLGDRVKTKFRR